MTHDIDNLDLDGMNTSDNDRIANRSRVELQGTGRGASAVKSIFHPSNRKRLAAYGVAGVVLAGAGIWTYHSVTANDARSVGGGVVESANVRASRNTAPTAMQRQEADRYNRDALKQEQQVNPTAHPVIVTSEGQDQFPEQLEMDKPNNVSSAVRATSGGQQAPSSQPAKKAAKPVASQAQADLLKGLMQAEAEVPSLQSVSWSYAQTARESDVHEQDAVDKRKEADDSTGTLAGDLPKKCKNPVIRAGRQYVARATIALNSDVGGPTIVEMVNGPLRKSRLIGKFERKEDWMRMTFTNVVGEADPKPINAIGLDMNTVLNAVGGDVDYHTMYRYGWWGVGAVLSAIGKAATANSNTTTYLVGDSVVQSTAADTSRELKIAAGDLGQSIGDVFKGRIDRPTTVSLKVNDLIGVVFMDDVCGDK